MIKFLLCSKTCMVYTTIFATLHYHRATTIDFLTIYAAKYKINPRLNVV